MIDHDRSKSLIKKWMKWWNLGQSWGSPRGLLGVSGVSQGHRFSTHSDLSHLSPRSRTRAPHPTSLPGWSAPGETRRLENPPGFQGLKGEETVKPMDKCCVNRRINATNKHLNIIYTINIKIHEKTHAINKHGKNCPVLTYAGHYGNQGWCTGKRSKDHRN